MAKLTELAYDKASVNLMKLHEELAAVLGEKYAGLSTGRGQLRVHIQDDMPQAKQDMIASIVEAHDATKLTAVQHGEANRTAKLDALRKPWAEWTAQDQADLLRLLAEQMGLIPIS